jgi:hypothetical protein
VFASPASGEPDRALRLPPEAIPGKGRSSLAAPQAPLPQLGLKAAHNHRYDPSASRVTLCSHKEANNTRAKGHLLAK